MASPTHSFDPKSTKLPNPLLSHGGSELQVILHPLVLLSISDCITRYTLRGHKAPIVGALLGQQNGREITIEHVFECHMSPANNGNSYTLHADFIKERYEQMVQVHKDRQLEFVGWYTLLPSTGPTPEIVHTHRFFLTNYNESAILLAFHPDQLSTPSAGGNLPLTIYESILEVEGGGAKPDQQHQQQEQEDVEDKKMEDSGESRLHLKFRELAYSVETDETERISMNYVAGGGGTANATTTTSSQSAATKGDKPSSLSVESNGKGKRRLVESTDPDSQDKLRSVEACLTREEEEMISSLTTKANAIKMLQSRVNLITSYLERLPPSFITGTQPEDENMDFSNNSTTTTTVPSLPVLRQIQALVSRLDLIIPSDKESFDREFLQETNNVNMLQLLNTIVQSAGEARDVGRKFGVVEWSQRGTRDPEYSETQDDGRSGGRAVRDML